MSIQTQTQTMYVHLIISPHHYHHYSPTYHEPWFYSYLAVNATSFIWPGQRPRHTFHYWTLRFCHIAELVKRCPSRCGGSGTPDFLSVQPAQLRRYVGILPLPHCQSSINHQICLVLLLEYFLHLSIFFQSSSWQNL